LEFVWHNFLTRNAIKGSKDSYSRLESNKHWTTISARCIEWWRHQNNHKAYPNHDPMDPKPQIQTL